MRRKTNVRASGAKIASVASHVLTGNWDDRGGKHVPPFRCRWFFSWAELGAGLIAGYFAGYEGGGAFVEEPFHARFANELLVEFVWHSCDHISGEDRPDMHFWPDEEVRECCDAHADIFLQWHDRNRWDEDGFLCLAPGGEQGLRMEQDCLFLFEPGNSYDAMERIRAMMPLTGIGCAFEDV